MLRRRESVKDRKADTRHKIQLGGLVIKAGLGEESSAVLLGALLEAADALKGPEASLVERRYKRRGDQAFKGNP